MAATPCQVVKRVIGYFFVFRITFEIYEIFTGTK